VCVRRFAATATVLGLLVLTGCGDDPEAAFNGTRLDEPYGVPVTALTDTDGEAFSLTEDTDQPLTLVFFGYTHCPDICPMVLSSLSSGLTKLDDADRERVQVVVVTTDPARDTAPVLREYLDGFDPSWDGLTGELDTIVEMAKPLGIYVDDGEKLPSGGYDPGGHGTSVIGIEDSENASVYWDQDTSPAQFAADIHTLLKEDE
jgi:protein SCO1